MDIFNSESTIHVRTDGHIGYLVLNRGQKRNALTEAMWSAIPEAVAALNDDKAVRVIIVCSSSEKIFAAGADIEELQLIATDPDRQESNRLAIRNAQRTLAKSSKPTIAMISGPCMGGGCGIALHCDFRYAADTASFGITPARLGIVYPLSDTKRLVDLVGPAKAKSMLFTGRKLDSAEALAIGLIDHCFAQDHLETEVHNFAGLMVGASQYSVRYIKDFVERVLEGQSDDDEYTAAVFRDSQHGVDAEEGLKAFLEKRQPNFKWPNTK